MTIEYNNLQSKCRQRVEVSGTRVVQVLNDDCGSNPFTVDGIFDMLRQNLTPNVCAGASCQCLLAYRTNAVYDRALGYPLVVLMVPVRGNTLPTGAEVWDQVQSPEPDPPASCGPIAPGIYEAVSVTELSPLPLP